MVSAALRSEHVWVPALFLFTSWAVRFGGFKGWRTASYVGDLAEDSGQFIWHFLHLWRVVTGDADLFFSDRVFYPVGLQMVRQDWAPTAALLALPFQPGGALFALNMEVLIAFTLCGFFTYLLARHLSGDRLLALMAGIIFAFCEFRMDKSFGHINQANQQFLPLYLLFLVLFFQSGRWRHAVGASVCFYLATFCTYYQLVFVVLLTLFFLLFKVGASLVGPGRGGRLLALGKRSLVFGCISSGVCVLLFGPLLFNQWQAFMEASRSLTYYMPAYSADLLSYVSSNLYVPPPQRIFTGEGGTAFMGYTVLALVLVSLGLVVARRRTGAGLWLFMVVVFFFISLGSTVMVAGEEVGRLPLFDVLQAIPVVRGAKVAARFSSLVILCAAVAVAITLAHADRTWLKPRWSRGNRLLLKGLIVAVVCAEMLIPPARFVQRAMPTAFPVPAAVHAVAQATGDPALIQFPLCWDAFTGNIGPHRFPRQLFAYQTVHGKPIFSGIGNMVPATTLRYLLRLPLVGELIRLGNGEALPFPVETPEQHRLAAQQVASALDVRNILLFKEMRIPGGDRVPERYQDALKYLHRTLQITLSVEDGSLMLFNVEHAPAQDLQGPWSMRFDGRGSVVHLGGGFRRVKEGGTWLAVTSLESEEEKELYLRLAQGAADTLSLDLRCTIPPCRMRVLLNGAEVGEISARAAWSVQRLSLPAAMVRKGINRLRLEPQAGGPAAVRIPLGRTGKSSPVGILVRSAGLLAGRAQVDVFVGGRSLVPDTRGYNLVVLDPDDGEVVAAHAFDLVDDPGGRKASQMVSFIQTIPPGMLVAVAVKDDGSIGFTDGIASALRSLGASTSPRGKLRHSYALLGVKGATPGTALEQLSRDVVELELGRRLQIRRLSLAGQSSYHRKVQFPDPRGMKPPPGR